MEDPHDLSFSSSLPPRASMVENMALALDQFSSGFFDSPSSNYVPRSNSYVHNDGRVRGHTFSSSVSSEGDIRTPTITSSLPRVNPRDSAKYQKNLAKLPSIFGEDEDSVRVKVYDAQRAGPSKPRVRRPTKGSANSTTSSIDLGHLAAFTGRMGPAGNRRSRSFDFGSTSRPSNTLNTSDGPEITAMPVLAAGPDGQGSPSKSAFPVQPPVRKNSTRSSKSAVARKGRSGTLGTSAIKSKPGEALPPMPVRTGVISDNPSPQEPAFAPKPGFFRRVFGSSRSASHNETALQSAQPSRPSQELSTPSSKLHKPTRTSTELSANKENQHPILSKKPSSFFRRRKKSISNTPPPPLPLTLTTDHHSAAIMGEPSPISSLRAFMDPYLVNNESDPPMKQRAGSKDSFHTPNIGIPNEDGTRTPTTGSHRRHGSRTDAQTIRQISTLGVPHQDSFLADSSSTERSARPSPRDPSPASNFSQHGKPSASYTSSRTDSPTPMLGAVQRPKVTDRQSSWSSVTGDLAVGRAASNGQNSRNVSTSSNVSSTLDMPLQTSRGSPPSTSPVSDYRSAPSTPVPTEAKKPPLTVHVSHPSISGQPTESPTVKARKIFDNSDELLGQDVAAAWLGEAGPEREKVRSAFMELFDFTHINILVSLRRLCDTIILKGETQQMDRLLLAFAQRWCACNRTHGFKSSDVVHTICYSILLLNTDLHLADIGQKMTKNQFVRNALPTIMGVGDENSEADYLKAGSRPSPIAEHGRPSSTDAESTMRLSKRPVDRLAREDSADVDVNATGGPLIDAPYNGSERGWEAQIEAVLRAFYTSISQQPLPLFGSTETAASAPAKENLLSLGANMLRRTPSTISKAHSDMNRPRYAPESKSLGTRWATKARSRPRLPSAPGFGSSRTSLDEQSSTWSPSLSSTWSKVSLGKTLTSMSVDSFGTEATHGDYQSSIGFANALSQAIIREDQFEINSDEGGMKAGPLLEDESLELSGAPWAKEGILKHKCHLEGVDKRSKDRNWNDCFAVIERGWMRLFSFSMTAKSLRTKAKSQKTSGVVGGGNWQDNAEEVWKFMLRHAIASALPPPGYSKTRPYVWALSLPTGAVHLFSVGTPDIVKEFVCTANFWSARLSKEPMMGGVSNMEYGWSDAVINRALINSDSSRATGSSSGSRPSTQMSIRSSIDQNGTVRPKLAGDRAYINEWNPPQQSMFASQLLEVDQLRALQAYVHGVEEELQKHNELRAPMQLAYSSRHINASKAMNNWEKKSSYLLREIVKFRTYIDTLQNAQATKERIHKMRKQEEENRQVQDDLNNLLGQQ
ncbi:uncharacterized protein HMPREF1541_09358 [Cyphellophora europaea CBS 101466]|uniref:SEC7 domain-containing protein n=1 Tax=Cyphellophora europaea (strain CBS 101466) TaxID=1220924 RepID=W2S9X5_CYPE1|nr:uncharacterized protein HMPREF1541_09358 [Cyphellophora europaea CBS 101466]ETN45526.1 hypothetical protein HMPREF1541_09358 [Cyphellophora europaea CBS 101466]